MKNNRAVFLALAVAVLMAPVAWWLVRDRSVWLWDQAWYGEVSADLWFTSHHSLRAWLNAMFFEMNLKPPGLVWIGQLFVPLRPVFGSIENALLAIVLIAQVVLLWLIYKIGEALQPAHAWAPLVGVFFAAATQTFVGLSHQFMVEPLQAVAVAWVVLVAAKSDEWPAARTLLHLSAATLLGLLVKLSTPAYCLLFYPYIGWKVLRSGWDWKREWSQRGSRILMCLFLAALPATALWYGVNAKPVWKHARESASGADVALHYGFRASLERKLGVWSGLLNQSFLAPYLVWVLALALIAGAIYCVRRRTGLGRILGLEVLGLGQIVIMLLAFSAADAVESRYLYAVMVYVAISATVLCARVGHGAPIALLLALCLWQWGVVNRAALGTGPALADPSPLLVAAHPDPTEYDEVTRMVERTSDAAGRYNIVGVEEPWLNANGASFFVAKRRLATGIRCYYTSLGYAETGVAAAWKRLDSLNVHYFITLDEQHQQAAPDFLNMVSLPVLKAVRQDPRFRQVEFPSARGMLIFERR